MSEVGNVSIWVGKYRANFGTYQTWIVAFQLQCFFLTKSKIFQFQQLLFNFSCAFQLWLELSNFTLYNFISNFPTFRSYQLQFPTTCIPLDRWKILRKVWMVHFRVVWSFSWKGSSYLLETYFQLPWVLLRYLFSL